MQIIDKQVGCFKIKEETICIINTGLHRDGFTLYAVLVPNELHEKGESQMPWKITECDDIRKNFMTASQLRKEYKINQNDLPKGSKAINDNWSKQKNKIDE